MQVEGALIPPGIHMLRISLLEVTTTYQLHRVTLEACQKGWCIY